MSDTDTKPATRMRRRYPVSNGELVVTGLCMGAEIFLGVLIILMVSAIV